ncbi:MAG: NmrA/HSCARG family protein [Pseudomonadota bacterium]
MTQTSNGDKASKTILVTGATGRQGSAVVDHLLKDGWSLRGMTRHPDGRGGRALAAKGVTPVQGNFDDVDSLRAATDGCYGVYSVQDFWEAGYKREVDQGKRVIDCAVEAGVQHFVYSSVGGAERTFGQGIHHFETKHLIEAHLRESGLRWTVFRPVTFFENFITPRYITSMCEKGVFRFPFFPERPFQMVAVNDLGAFVAAAFREPERFEGLAMELASDQLTMQDFSDAVGETIGRPVTFEELSMTFFGPILRIVGWMGKTAKYRVGPSIIAQGKWHRTTAPETGGWTADFEQIESFDIPLTKAKEWAKTIDWDALRQANG